MSHRLGHIIDFDAFRRQREPGRVHELEWESPLFIDWLTIRQVYPHGGLPVFAGGYLTSWDADGVEEYQLVKRGQIEGSFDDRMHLRCDGNSVEFHGNIARWERPDNVFGYPWHETIRRVNLLLARCQLPPFTAGDRARYADSGTIWTGARISRIDLTMNYACGNAADAHRLIAQLGQHHVGRQRGTVTPDQATVEYGAGSKYVYGKCYIKHLELQRNRKRKSGSHVGDDVIDFCQSLGIVREEFTLKSRFLTQTALCWLGEVTPELLLDVYRQRSQFRRFREMEISDTSKLSPGARGTLARYEQGEPHGLKRPTYYRHRKEILKVCGIDISVPRNVEKVVLPARVIEVSQVVAPEWYRKKYG